MCTQPRNAAMMSLALSAVLAATSGCYIDTGTSTSSKSSTTSSSPATRPADSGSASADPGVMGVSTDQRPGDDVSAEGASTGNASTGKAIDPPATAKSDDTSSDNRSSENTSSNNKSSADRSSADKASDDSKAAAAAEGKPTAQGSPTAEKPAEPTTPPKRELLAIESTSRRGVIREAGIEVITFDDLNLGMQADMVFRDFLLTDRARELDGKKVRLVGYMDGGVSQTKGIKEFVLLRNTECKFGPGGQADHLVRVLMKGDSGADYSLNALQVEGILKISPFNGPDGNTWSVYDVEGESVRTIRGK